MRAQSDHRSWFDAEILPVERLIFRSDLAAIGLFRCDKRSPWFSDSGPIRNHVFAFPRTTVAIQHKGSHRFLAGPTAVTVYNRGQEYQRFAAQREQSDDCDWFAVAPDILLDVISRYDPSVMDRSERPFRFEYTASSATLYARQRSLIDRILTGTASTEEVEEEVIAISSQLFSASIGRPILPANAKSSRERVEHAKAILACTLEAPPSLRELARLTGTSAYHLCRIFQRITGFAIHEYQQQLRLRVALERVDHSDDLLDTALSLGFSSHSHFTAAFRKTFGITPSQYRRESHLRTLKTPHARASHPETAT